MRHSETAKKIALGIAKSAQFIGSFLGGMMVGWLADERFSSAPIGLCIGLCVGFAFGCIGLIRSTKDGSSE